MNTPLVTPVDPENDPELLELVRFYNETLGFCPNSIMTMYRRPEIAYSFIALNKAVMENKGRVTSALKRLIGFISSNTAGCKYCQAHTIRAAERYGASAEQMEHIWDFRTHPSFNDAERAALEAAFLAACIPNSFDERAATTLRKYWDPGEIVEIMGVIALFGFLNRWNDSMGTPIEPGARESGELYLGGHGWNPGKHGKE